MKIHVRYGNAINTLNSLLILGIIPIVNENDTVAVDEIITENQVNARKFLQLMLLAFIIMHQRVFQMARNLVSGLKLESVLGSLCA